MAAKSESSLGQRNKGDPDRLMREMKKLEDLGYCSDVLSPTSYGSVKNSSGKRVPSFNISDLWGKRMTRQVIRQSGYLQAYRALKSQGIGPKKSPANPPDTPKNMDDFALRRLIYEHNQRKLSSILAKEASPIIPVKVADCEPVVPNVKMNRKVMKLILNCEDLQQSSCNLQSVLTPPSRSKVQKPKKLSATERKLFNRFVEALK
jgi:hypothetical protein